MIVNFYWLKWFPPVVQKKKILSIETKVRVPRNFQLPNFRNYRYLIKVRSIYFFKKKELTKYRINNNFLLMSWYYFKRSFPNNKNVWHFLEIHLWLFVEDSRKNPRIKIKLNVHNNVSYVKFPHIDCSFWNITKHGS